MPNNTMKIISVPGYLTKPLPIDNYQENAARFHKIIPYFYDKTGTFWFWSNHDSRYEQVDDTDVMRTYDNVLGYQGQTVSTKIKVHTLEAMRRYGRQTHPKKAKKKWVQFRDKAYSIHSGKIHAVTPDYFFTNPIPWEIGENAATPSFDALFEAWVGKDRVVDLYEIIAYCCYTDYPIQTLFCLYGFGRNGKTTFTNLLTRFVGDENVCSTDLDLLVGNNKSRFEAHKLYKKLVCSMGETNFGVLNSSSLIKKLTGGDKIGFEKKGKDPFDEYSYAKIIISSNSLPSSADTSDGFYRRWHIIDFPNEFPEGQDVLKSIPDEEYCALANKSMGVLRRLLRRGSFTNQGKIEERKERYILASNPITKFIDSLCEVGEDHSTYFCQYSELYTAYTLFLRLLKRRKVRLKEFRGALEDEGFWLSRTSKPTSMDDQGYPVRTTSNWVEGVRLVDDWKEKLQKLHFFTKFPTPTPSHEKLVGESMKSATNATFDASQTAHISCTVEGCVNKECNFDTHGIPYCKKHIEEMGQ